MNSKGFIKPTNLVTLAILTGMFFVMTGGAALAAYPHTDFVSAPDACAACHRMHTATANNLLKDPAGSCKSCHADGLAADTDVENGTYIAVSGEDAAGGHVWGADAGTLLAGGFDFVGGTAPAGVAASSKHNVDAGSFTPPGTSNGALTGFTCTSCHSAHLDKNHPNQYRLLRYDINGQTVDVTWNGPWTDATQATKGGNYRAYTDTDFGAGAGVQYYTKNYNYSETAGSLSDISKWCAACHTHYLASPEIANGYKSGDVYNAGDTYGPAARHRHSVNIPIRGRTVGGNTYDLTSDMPLADLTADGRTNDDLLVCVSCHRAHGSAASMSGSAVLLASSRGTILPSGVDSLLLRTDDRVMCVQCHNM